jgi:hypothetical protein
MARQRRGGGFRTPELKGTLGTLLRTTREVLERGAREGRERLDEALSGRRRDSALADLGEIVLDLIRRGEIDLADLPEAREIVARLDELDAEDGDTPAAPPPSRERFDRRRGSSSDDGTVSAKTWAPPNKRKAPERVWRPTAPEEPPAPAPPKASEKRGGISFEDEDLADYMHPDDVPPKGTKGGDS